MCGIAGFIGHRQITQDTIVSGLKSMQRRGPDAQSWRHWVTVDGRNVYLMHARLNIIDLNHRSDQPMTVGNHTIAFNGEVYNFQELRRELEAEGETFGTESDTEVLLRILRAKGQDGLDRCEGMWSFALFNEQNGELTLSRDRFGEKPLYLHRTPEGLYFASEVNTLAVLTGKRFTPDLAAIKRHLVNGYRSVYKQRATYFTDIEELPSGTCLKIDANGVETLARYWSFTYAPRPDMTFADATAQVREALIKAVEIRLRSDVPLAFCLSGGVDSSALVSIAKKIFDYDVHGFTIVARDGRYDESEVVNRTVAELGIRHSPVPLVTEGFLGRLRTQIKYHAAPIITIAYYTHQLLSEAISAQGYRISLSGSGADEFFTGYYDHHLMYLARRHGDPEGFAEARANWERWIKPVVRNPLLQDPEAFVKNPSQRGHIYLNADEFAEFLVEPWHEPFIEETFIPQSLLRNRMLNELFRETVPPILHEDDLNAMYYSIENRSPFLDRRLFDLSMTIPDHLLVRDGMAKAVLREAMRGIAPDHVLDNRRKTGFNAPILELLDVDDPDTRASLLEDSPIFEVVRRDRIERMLTRRDLLNSESKFIFYFLGAKMFLEEFA